MNKLFFTLLLFIIPYFIYSQNLTGDNVILPLTNSTKGQVKAGQWNLINAYGTKNVYISNSGNFTSPVADSNFVGGWGAFKKVKTGSRNVILGTYAGRNIEHADGTVWIGNETGGDSIFADLDNIGGIDNSDTICPLLYFDFANNIIRICGTLDVDGGLIGGDSIWSIDYPLQKVWLSDSLFSVGIGTSNPNGSLDVIGSTALDEVYIQDANSRGLSYVPNLQFQITNTFDGYSTLNQSLSNYGDYPFSLYNGDTVIWYQTYIFSKDSLAYLKHDGTYAFKVDSVGEVYIPGINTNITSIPTKVVGWNDVTGELSSLNFSTINQSISVQDSTWDLDNADTIIKVMPYSQKKQTDPGYPYFYTNNDTTIVNYGYLYNWYAITDTRKITSSDSWVVPDKTKWDIFYAYVGVTAGKLKETGITHWTTPNTGATNELGFNLRGGGRRINTDGTFGSIMERGYLGYLYNATTWTGYYMDYNSDAWSSFYNFNYAIGIPLRLIKTSTILSNGEEGLYVGNDGKRYRTICIDTQEWLADNLCETLYRDGSTITEVTDNATWAALTTEARCSYNNNEDSSFTYIESSPTYDNELRMDGVLDITDIMIQSPTSGKSEYITYYNPITKRFSVGDTGLFLGGSIIDHGELDSLLNDDHTQYALLVGRVGDNIHIDTVSSLNNILYNKATGFYWEIGGLNALICNNGYLRPDEISMSLGSKPTKWNKLYTTNIVDDNTNIFLIVPSKPLYTEVLVVSNDTIGKTTLPVNTDSQSLSYAKSTGIMSISGGTADTINLFTSTNRGLVPQSGGGSANFMRADGTWATPPGTTVADNLGNHIMTQNLITGSYFINYDGVQTDNGISFTDVTWDKNLINIWGNVDLAPKATAYSDQIAWIGYYYNDGMSGSSEQKGFSVTPLNYPRFSDITTGSGYYMLWNNEDSTVYYVDANYLTVEVDGSITNEGLLDVTDYGTTGAQITSNTSTSPRVTLESQSSNLTIEPDNDTINFTVVEVDAVIGNEGDTTAHLTGDYGIIGAYYNQTSDVEWDLDTAQIRPWIGSIVVDSVPDMAFNDLTDVIWAGADQGDIPMVNETNQLIPYTPNWLTAEVDADTTNELDSIYMNIVMSPGADPGGWKYTGDTMSFYQSIGSTLDLNMDSIINNADFFQRINNMYRYDMPYDSIPYYDFTGDGILTIEDIWAWYALVGTYRDAVEENEVRTYIKTSSFNYGSVGDSIFMLTQNLVLAPSPIGVEGHMEHLFDSIPSGYVAMFDKDSIGIGFGASYPSGGLSAWEYVLKLVPLDSILGGSVNVNADTANWALDADKLDGQHGAYYLDNTDAQDLSLSVNTLSLTGDGTSVDLSGYLDNTDAQTTSFNTSTGELTISGGNTTDLDGRYLETLPGSALEWLDTTAAAGIGIATYNDIRELVDTTGTPINNQLAIFTDGNSIEGDTSVTWNGTSFLIDKNISSPEIALINDGGIGGATFKMKDNGSGTDWRFKATSTGEFKIRDHENSLDVVVIENNSSANSLYIDVDGDVGLNDNTPSYKLDVTGDINATGDYRKAGNIMPIGYSLQMAPTATNLLSATTYYCGSATVALTTTQNQYRCYIPKGGTVRAAYIYFVKIAGGVYTSGNFIMSVNVNNSATEIMSVANSNTQLFSNTALSVAVAQGDILELKITMPTMSSTATSCYIAATIYIE